MSSSVNFVSSGCSNQSIGNSNTKKTMDFLSHKISEVFNKTDQVTQPIELAKELFMSKRKTVQETEEVLKRNTVIANRFDKNTIKVFSLSLQKLPDNPIQEGLKYIKMPQGIVLK